LLKKASYSVASYSVASYSVASYSVEASDKLYLRIKPFKKLLEQKPRQHGRRGQAS